MRKGTDRRTEKDEGSSVRQIRDQNLEPTFRLGDRNPRHLAFTVVGMHFDIRAHGVVKRAMEEQKG